LLPLLLFVMPCWSTWPVACCQRTVPGGCCWVLGVPYGRSKASQVHT
jgi:hypothetical protein